MLFEQLYNPNSYSKNNGHNNAPKNNMTTINGQSVDFNTITRDSMCTILENTIFHEIGKKTKHNNLIHPHQVTQSPSMSRSTSGNSHKSHKSHNSHNSSTATSASTDTGATVNNHKNNATTIGINNGISGLKFTQIDASSSHTVGRNKKQTSVQQHNVHSSPTLGSRISSSRYSACASNFENAVARVTIQPIIPRNSTLLNASHSTASNHSTLSNGSSISNGSSSININITKDVCVKYYYVFVFVCLFLVLDFCAYH